MRVQRLALVVAFVAAAGLWPEPAIAHDLWIEPERLSVPSGDSIAVALRVGDAFAGRPVARNPRWIERFSALGPGGETALLGEPGHHPAGHLQTEQAGSYWLLYRSRPSTLTLDADRFESYLAEEGLDHVLAARRQRGEQTEPGRERFSRCAKALLRVESEGEVARPPLDSASLSRPTGLPLDLIPLADPRSLGGAGDLPIRLIYDNQPLAGTLLEAHGPDGRRQAVRSDSRGEATFDLDVAGDWLLTAVHMVPAPEGSGVDWESLWSSLRFELTAD